MKKLALIFILIAIAFVVSQAQAQSIPPEVLDAAVEGLPSCFKIIRSTPDKFGFENETLMTQAQLGDPFQVHEINLDALKSNDNIPILSVLTETSLKRYY